MARDYLVGVDASENPKSGKGLKQGKSEKSNEQKSKPPHESNFNPGHSRLGQILQKMSKKSFVANIFKHGRTLSRDDLAGLAEQNSRDFGLSEKSGLNLSYSMTFSDIILFGWILMFVKNDRYIHDPEIQRIARKHRWIDVFWEWEVCLRKHKGLKRYCDFVYHY